MSLFWTLAMKKCFASISESQHLYMVTNWEISIVNEFLHQVLTVGPILHCLISMQLLNPVQFLPSARNLACVESSKNSTFCTMWLISFIPLLLINFDIRNILFYVIYVKSSVIPLHLIFLYPKLHTYTSTNFCF